jgi:hypothetical protein
LPWGVRAALRGLAQTRKDDEVASPLRAGPGGESQLTQSCHSLCHSLFSILSAWRHIINTPTAPTALPHTSWLPRLLLASATPHPDLSFEAQLPPLFCLSHQPHHRSRTIQTTHWWCGEGEREGRLSWHRQRLFCAARSSITPQRPPSWPPRCPRCVLEQPHVLCEPLHP